MRKELPEFYDTRDEYEKNPDICFKEIPLIAFIRISLFSL